MSLTIRIRQIFISTVFFFVANSILAQTTIWKEVHKVKRKETIYGIAQENGLTIEELKDANPEMKKEGYQLKKGDIIYIPFSSSPLSKVTETETKIVPTEVKKEEKSGIDITKREVRLGVILPLNNDNDDGKHMVEYYRGVLMACDSLKQNGVSVDIRTWNVVKGADISSTLADPKIADRDIIIGPLYPEQIKLLADFAAKHDIKLLVPFSALPQEVRAYGNVYQVFQDPVDYYEAVVAQYLARFSDAKTIVIDCNDDTSGKSSFTSSLRKGLEKKGIPYSITNLNTPEEDFRKAFVESKKNIVVLNTASSTKLTVAIAKLNGLVAENENILVSLFGYSEWVTYIQQYLDDFYRFDTYIPASFHYNPLYWRTARMEQKFRWNFHVDMDRVLPRYAITGFDQAFYFIKGLHDRGKSFNGAKGAVNYAPIQTPLFFEKADDGCYYNRGLLFIHYTKENKVETIFL